ncbi:MAG: polyprenyl synthetase family protein [Acidimicrobiales bacterium]
MTPVPSSLLAIAPRVEERLRVLIDGELSRWVRLDPALVAPLTSLGDLLLSGGKRIRPAFCYWAFVGAGGDPAAPLVADAGAAFELLHAFALVHDDVMDGSSTRRGRPTAHLAFAGDHREREWIGEARRFGDGVAILIGDLAAVYADVLLRDAPAPAIAVWNELRIELNLGQYLDLVGTAEGQRGRDAAERIARYKSGKYTVERPLHVGTALAAPEHTTQLLASLSRYGLPVGDAFQLRDDLLGAFGDETLTGKPVGDDLREGKPTTLLAIATARATGAEAAQLARVGASDLGDDEVEAIQRVLQRTGAREELEAQISALADEAIAALDCVPFVDEALVALTELAHFVVRRTA